MREGAVVIVVPIELQGTFAQRVARVRGDAEFALWAVPFGGDWRAAWSSCTRPDWMLEVLLLADCQEHGCAAHRRVVGWLAEEARAAYPLVRWGTILWGEAVAEEVKRALVFAEQWSTNPFLPDFPAFALIARFPTEVVRYDARTPPKQLRVSLKTLAMANAGLRTCSSAIDPASPLYAVRALARVWGGQLENEGLARRFEAAFACPQALRCELPS